MNIGKIYIPKGFSVIVIIFAAIFLLGIKRDMGAISGLSMACLFSCIASLIAYIISAFKKKKSGVYLFSFVVLLAGLIISTFFTPQYKQSKNISAEIITEDFELL